MPDGTEFRGGTPATDYALSSWVAQAVHLVREEDVSHFDEAPVSILTTGSLRALHQVLGKPIDPRRFRANLLVDVEEEGFVEDQWVSRRLRVGGRVCQVGVKATREVSLREAS